eukprot:Em0009g678a
MSHIHSSREKPSDSVLGAEATGKQLFRHAWECSQRIDQAAKLVTHFVDLFHPDLVKLRTKLRNSCERILMVSCSQRRKTEELLWKKVFYDIISLYRQRVQVPGDVASNHVTYHTHLSEALAYYSELVPRLEKRYGTRITRLDSSQLEELECDSADVEWLKESCYRCLLYMGDIARYQSEAGGPPYKAITYYHHAISIDPTKGAPFNQLASLAGDKNEFVDAVYYYQRSITTPQPFEGSEVNLQRIYQKCKNKLNTLLPQVGFVGEPDIRRFTRELFLLRFLRLHSCLTSSLQPEGFVLGEECQGVIQNLEDCLKSDLQLYELTCIERVHTVLSEQDADTPISDVQSCLPCDVLLKVSALSLLPSHTLRLQGSPYTPVATAFALSIFSLSSSTTPTNGWSMVDLLLGYQQQPLVSVITTKSCAEAPHVASLVEKQGCEGNDPAHVPTGLGEGSAAVGTDQAAPTKPVKKSKAEGKKGVVDRRRRKPAAQMSSEEESEGSGGEEPSSEDNLSLLSDSMEEDEEPDMLESLSETGTSGEEDAEEVGTRGAGGKFTKGSGERGARESEQKGTMGSEEKDLRGSEEKSAGGSVAKGPKEPLMQQKIESSPTLSTVEKPKRPVLRRPVSLAANFQTPLEDGRAVKTDATSGPHTGPAPRGMDTSAQASFAKTEEVEEDKTLGRLLQDTRTQAAVHTACRLVAEDGYLLILKCFLDWLQSHPVVIATCAQSTATIWSRLATLLNFLPTITLLERAGTIQAGVWEHWSQSVALMEDLALRGFAPLVRSQEKLSFDQRIQLSKLQQTGIRIACFHVFGHYLAGAQTAPAFTWSEEKEQYLGPEQRAQLEAKKAREAEILENQTISANRSKLMRAMAHQKLQTEVAALAETSAKKKAAIFTPYLMPDAISLCEGLHIVKRLLKTERFVWVIARSVIETLDSMKKGKENYLAREAIKFLEKEFKAGNRFIRAQQASETVQQPGKKKPPKQDLNIWNFQSLVDCAVYLNQKHLEATGSAVVTLLLEKPVVLSLQHPERESKVPELVEVATQAVGCGVEVDTMHHFFNTWKKSSSSTQPS